MSAPWKRKLDGLIAALRKADADLSAAIDEHGRLDAQKLAERTPARTRQLAAVQRAEARAHDDVSDALEALCRYRPRTPEELSSYVLTLLNHWRIKDTSFEGEHDRACLVALLANVTASTAALVFRGG